ncbi:MAG TPA: hypothetical protein VE172_00700, partial [Stackebrandtia sp.]|uniref:hypothetical protein n=1 Tax=Stackebrandtia sp. TaxID=2023065 RepID=UPI002D4CBAE3
AQHKECGLWGADFDTKEDGKWKQRIHIESDMAPLSGMDLSWRLCLDPHDYTAKVKISANRGGGEFPNHHDKAGMGDQSETNTAAACANIADANGRATRELTLKNLDKLGTTHIDPRFFCIRTEKHLVRVSTADYKTISVDTNALDAQIILTVTTWTRGKSV